MKSKVLLTAVAVVLLISGQAAIAQPAPPPAAGPPPSARQLELAREVMAATGVESSMSNMFHNMTAQLTASMTRNLPPDRQARLEVVGQAEEDVMSRLTPRLIQTMVESYARTFTEQELTDLLAFYRSPTGRSMVAKTPQLMQGVVTEMVTLAPQMRREIGEEVCAKLACSDAEKAAYFGPPPGGPARP